MIAAEPREFSGLLKFCTDVKRLGWPLHWAREAALNGCEVLLVANGAGGVRSAEAVTVASSDRKLNWICSMGFCGALESGMQVGDIFVAERVDTRVSRHLSQSYGVLVVTAGEGRLATENGASLPVGRGSTALIPHAAGPAVLTGTVEGVRCLPAD